MVLDRQGLGQTVRFELSQENCGGSNDEPHKLYLRERECANQYRADAFGTYRHT